MFNLETSLSSALESEPRKAMAKAIDLALSVGHCAVYKDGVKIALLEKDGDKTVSWLSHANSLHEVFFSKHPLHGLH